MPAPVSWEIAQRVAVWFGSGRAPLGPTAPQLSDDEMAELRDDFSCFTALAEELVVEATGLRPMAGPAESLVVDRGQWVQRNLDSFRRLLDPLLEKVEGASAAGPVGAVMKNAAGVELGVVLGWLSTRVLGQYDLLLTEGDPGNVVAYVGPNIVAIERKSGFPPKQFRLWIALHEVTHRCQFTGVPWLHGHFLSLVDQALRDMDPDPKRFQEALRRLAAGIRSGRNPLDEAGLLGLVSPPEQLSVLRSIQATMSLLEGHGDITMDRAGHGHVDQAEWFSRTMRERRKKAGVPARILLQLTGMEAKMRQYVQGEQFIEAVEAAGGAELFSRVWESPSHLPNLDEIRCPELWIARMATPGLVAG